MKPKLIASSATLEGIQRLASEYFCGSAVHIREVCGAWEVYTKTCRTDTVIRKRGNRYRLEERGPCLAIGAGGAECGRAGVPLASNPRHVGCPACQQLIQDSK